MSLFKVSEMPPFKYVDFEVSAPFETIAKHSKEKTSRQYVSIACPHCLNTFADVPIECIDKQKSTKCKAHLEVCSEFKAKGGNVAPAPKRAKTTYENTHTPKHDDEMITIYKLIYKPENRAVYTGRTKNINERFKQHAQRSSKCRLVRNAIRRHGVRQYSIEPIVRCHAADADANESYYIIANNTLHPNGYNLRHGSKAGEESNDETRVAVSASDTVPFSNARDEFHAHMEANEDLADICEDLEDCSDVDKDCDNLLCEVHPCITDGKAKEGSVKTAATRESSLSKQLAEMEARVEARAEARHKASMALLSTV